jgi:acetyl esterase/lipase
MARLLQVLALLLLFAEGAGADAPVELTHTWQSPATGGRVDVRIRETDTPLSGAASLPVVLYLVNLAAARVGTESDEAIVRDLLAEGFLVVEVDYALHPRANTPWIQTDLVRLRQDIREKHLLADRRVDAARIFIVPSGCRLRRDVVFFREEFRVLAMDVVYPSKPARPVGAVLEFSCDNADRMGNLSLTFCTDALLPAAAIEGHAAAMSDHPVAAPYKGLDPMPESAWKAKAAVRTLRAVAPELGLNGRIVTAGFSRGSGMALLTATTAGRLDFEARGEHVDQDDDVQGAVVLSGRFTYLDLLPEDKMIARYEKAWGSRETSLETWRLHGALDHLTAPTVPLFLSINATESPDALHQMNILRRRLTELESPFTYRPEMEPRGHRMPLAPEVLEQLRAYLRERLQEPAS